jgi:hypothetical protein
MSRVKISDQVVLSLADQYEHGNVNGVEIVEDSVEEYADFKQRYATLVAEDSLTQHGSTYQFTDAGYLRYSDRIKALRVFGPA